MVQKVEENYRKRVRFYFGNFKEEIGCSFQIVPQEKVPNKKVGVYENIENSEKV